MSPARLLELLEGDLIIPRFHRLPGRCQWLINAVIVYLTMAATWITVVILNLVASTCLEALA